jgi:predicted permease
MSLWSRFRNTFRAGRMSREIEEELELHIADAIDEGLDPAEARRAIGPMLRHREQSRDLRLLPWLDSLLKDAVFGWRQLLGRKGASIAAILSLALGIASCTAAFRLLDALLWRPLPVAHPERLYAISFEDPARPDNRWDSCSYPMFRTMRDQVKDQAELIAASYTEQADLTYASDQDMEKTYRQYISGWMFPSLGIGPAAGRLFTENDDLRPGAHPYAVLSYDYWTRRFGRDPKTIGRTLRMGNESFEIVGVSAKGFTGIEPGVVTDVFLPAMMKSAYTLATASSFWFRTLVLPRPGASIDLLRDKLSATYHALDQERLKTFATVSKDTLERSARVRLSVDPAPSGVSRMQSAYRRPLAILGMLAALVLLIACANVANLMTAQGAARSREMALRVSIGAGRGRLVQLVLVEGALVACLASGCGALLAWWAAPGVVSMLNPPGDPAHLVLPADWRVLGFGLALGLSVAFLFGLPAALRASSVKPALAIKGGEAPHSRRRLMRILIAAQAAFCFPVLFVAGLFVATVDRLDKQPTGFSANRLLTLEIVADRSQPDAYWDQLIERLRSAPGVESVALSSWALLSGAMTNSYIAIDGVRAGTELTFFQFISPGWLATMGIPLIDGADFTAADAYPGPVIVNETFVKRYFANGRPLGKWFERLEPDGRRLRLRIAGVVPDVRDRNMRDAVPPTAFVPFHSVPKRGGTIVVRVAQGDPMALASVLRKEVPRARPEFRVSNARSQSEIVRSHMLRERLLAALAAFFGIVALLLAALGLYGVLDYSVLQQRREIGIRIAIGAPSAEIARRVTLDAFAMVLAGAAAGVGIGIAVARYVEALLYGVRPTGWSMLAPPLLAIFAAAFLAAVPAVRRAIRIDPVGMLRSE